jgi:tripartite-type tricarboxylate transporter receptor subunit TctC
VRAATPPDIVDKIYQASEEAMTADVFQQDLRKTGLDLVLNQTPDQFAAFVKAETDTWKKVLASVSAAGKTQ